MKTFIYISLFLSSSLYSQNAFFDIDVDGTVFTGPWTAGEESVIQDLLQDVEDAGQTDLIDFDVTEYFKNSANASAIASSFVGSDYTNEFKFLFGINVSPAVVGKDASALDLLSGDLQEDVIEGAAASGSIMLGYQFGDKHTVIVNGFSAAVEDGDFKLGFKTVGARYRRRLFASSKELEAPVAVRETSSTQEASGYTNNAAAPSTVLPPATTTTPVEESPKISNRIETRVYLQTGIQYNTMNINYKKPVNLTETSSSSGVNATATFDSTLNLDVDINTLSIPIELSGSVRFFRFLNLYGGLGGNLNFGSGSGEATFDDSFITVVDNTNNAKTARTGVKANFSEKESPAVFLPNLFTGVQLDLWKLKLLVQYRLSLGKGVHNVGASVRLAF